MCFVILTWGVSSVLASKARINGSVMASPDAEDHGTDVRTDTPTNEPLFWLSGLPVPACLSLSRNTPNMAEWAASTSRFMTGTERRAARSFKVAAGAEKLRR